MNQTFTGLECHHQCETEILALMAVIGQTFDFVSQFSICQFLHSQVAWNGVLQMWDSQVGQMQGVLHQQNVKVALGKNLAGLTMIG